MGLFDTTDSIDNDRKPAERKPTSALQRIAIAGVVALALTALFPGYTAVLVAAVGAYEVRRVRRRWFAAWAAATFALGWAMAGASLTAWTSWSISQIAHTFPWMISSLPETNAFTNVADSSLPQLIWMQLWGCAPAALLTTIAIATWRSHAREIRGQIEGHEHSNQRPVGILDRRRRERERKRITSGYYLSSTHSPKQTGQAKETPTDEEETRNARPSR